MNDPNNYFQTVPVIPITMVITGILMIVYLWSKVYFVPENMLMVVVRFGRYKRTCTSGLSILSPFESPFQLNQSHFEYVDMVHQSIYLPMRFLFDPDDVDVSSKHSTKVNVDPVLSIKVIDMQKLYFTYARDDPFAILVGKMEDMLNEVSRTYDMIGREQFKEIAQYTREKMQGFCKELGIEITSFELQDMMLSEERLALEAKAESEKRSLQIETEQQTKKQELAMRKINNEKERTLRELQAKQTEVETQLNYDLANAKKRVEIARVEAEKNLQLMYLLNEKKLADPYFQQQQLKAQQKLNKAIVAGNHTTFVVEPNKMLPFYSLGQSNDPK